MPYTHPAAVLDREGLGARRRAAGGRAPCSGRLCLRCICRPVRVRLCRCGIPVINVCIPCAIPVVALALLLNGRQLAGVLQGVRRAAAA